MLSMFIHRLSASDDVVFLCFTFSMIISPHFTASVTYLLTLRVVGVPQIISQPASSPPVHSLMLSSHLFFCLPCLLLPFTLRCKMVFWPDLMNGRHVHTTAVCISSQWSGGLHMVRLPDGSWHELHRG